MRLIDADHLIPILKEYIKREDSYISICNNPTLAKGIRRGLQEAVRTVKKEPTAQPIRKKGKWIYGEDEYGIDGYHCDKCGFFVPWDYTHTFINYIEDYKFCPNCGSYNGGEQDDSF